MAHPNEESLDVLRERLAMMELDWSVTGEPDMPKINALKSQIDRLEREEVQK